METKKTKKMWAMAGIGVLILVVGFFGGMKYGESRVSQAASARFAQGNGQQAGTLGAGAARKSGMMQSGNFAGGQIIAKDDKSITVQLRDGSSKIVFFSSSTEIMKSAQGSLTDLTVGGNVTVSGTTNQDGSITAQSVQIRPAFPTTGQ